MKTMFLQSSANRFPLFLLSVAIFMTGAVFIWFIWHLSGYDNVQSVVTHQHSAWLVIATISILAIVMAAWLVATRVLYKSQKTLLIKNAEMKRTEEALQQSEGRFRDLIENANDLIYTGDLQGNFTSLNKVGEIITGYSEAEFCQMNFAGVVAPEYLENAKRKFAHKITSGLPTAYELEIITKNGQRVALDLNNRVVLQAGKPIGVQGIGRDITARKRTEETLRESEARYRVVTESASDAIITIDQKQTILFVNSAAEKIFGYAVDEMLGNKLSMLMPEHLRGAHAAGMKRYAATNKRNIPWQGVELPGLHKDGYEVPLEITFGEIHSDGKHLFTAVLRDITERRRNKEELQKNLSLLTSTFEATADGILVVDRDNRIVTYNQRFVEMWQIPDEIIDLKDNAKAVDYVLEQLINADDFADTTNYLTANPENKHFDLLKFKDGKVYERHSHPQILDGNVVGRVLSFRDTTERKRAEEKLRESQEWMQAIFDASRDGIVIEDDEKVVYINKSYARLLGYEEPEEIIGKQILELVSPEDTERMMEYGRRRLRGEQVPSVYEFKGKRKDGTLVETEGVVSTAVVGGKKYIMTASRDITERKLAEELTRQSEEKYRNILETVEEGYFETDLEGVFTFYNEALGNVLGYDTDELLGMPYQRYVDHRNAKKLFLAYAKVYRTGQPVSEFNWEVIRDDGTRKFLESSITLILNAAGAAVGFRGLARDVTNRRQTEAALRDSENKYRLLIESTSEGLLQVDINDRTQFINNRFCEMVGYSAAELINKNWTQMLLNDEGRNLIGQANERRRKGIADRYEIQLRKKSGEMLWVIVGGAPTLNAKGIVIGSMGVFTDITASKKVEEVLKAGETMQRQLAERQSAILDALPAHICLLDQSGKILEVNNEWKRFALENGYSGVNFGVGSNYLEMCDNATDECGEGARQAADACRAVLSGESSHFEMEYPCHSPDEKRWFKLTVTPLHKEKSGGAVVMHLNITERKRIEEQLFHDAFHDGLTGLANRTLFTDHLQMTIERTKRDRSELFAVLFLDFDRFKVINDSLGHAEGDNLLKQIARRLESSLRSGDLVARLGGDEFTILLNNLGDSSVALRVAERIQKNLESPFEIGGGEIFISASIGIALSTSGHERAEDMLRDADIAMYRAKGKGKARHQVFDQAMHEQALAQLRIETELRQAVEQKEFCLYYQPIFSLETSRIVGFEALVRWKHPKFGMIAPSDFIPIAEDNGLIIPLGQWILHESCRQMREWQIADPSASSLTVSVNLSFKQFLQLDLAEQVAATLKETRLDPKCLKLEITESHLMENSEKAIVVMNRLRALGVELSLDDFGTGYSSLSYLHRLPVSYLKIDRSFVARMIESEENGEIVHTIIKLTQNLKMKVIAEGIETVEQLNYLKNLNCEFGQGYYFSKPLEATAAERFIEDNREKQIRLLSQPIINAEVNI